MFCQNMCHTPLKYLITFTLVSKHEPEFVFLQHIAYSQIWSINFPKWKYFSKFDFRWLWFNHIVKLPKLCQESIIANSVRNFIKVAWYQKFSFSGLTLNSNFKKYHTHTYSSVLELANLKKFTIKLQTSFLMEVQAWITPLLDSFGADVFKLNFLVDSHT